MTIKNVLDDEKTHLRQVYQRIIILALLVHTLYAVTFWFFDLYALTVYHIFSDLFYLCMLRCVGLEKFRLTVSAIHIEVCLFVSVNTLLCGWEAGFAMYLIAIATLVYFCPFDHPFIPYLFSLTEVCIFFILKFIIVPHTIVVSPLPSYQLTILYFLNAVSAFIIILYAALISNVSAATTKKVLLEDNESLKEIADHDQLTTLLTRHYLLDKIKSTDLLNEKITVVMADIDNFKNINDQYGHPCGDYILQTLSLLIKTHLPESFDVCRWGGEEFVIVAYHQDQQQIIEQINNLCHVIEEYHFIYEHHTMQVTMTFGIAYNQEEIEFDKLIDLADKRLYYGKNNGKNTVIDQL